MKPNRRSEIQTKHKRNEELVKDYQQGMPIKEMIAKYQITKGRIYQILNRA